MKSCRRFSCVWGCCGLGLLLVGACVPMNEPVGAVNPVQTAARSVQDDDGDGVANDQDKCPNTPIGARVNPLGCWVLENLQFASGSVRIEPAARPVIHQVVVVLKANPRLKLGIYGHADNTGSDEMNETLARQRAEAIKSIMIAHGIAADRLEARGLGAAHPIAVDNDPVSRAINRRVELKPLP
ncbi:MAG: OmpA family protein [Magnetococcales bacterium]|nr:OmpA family protein [Magnetococcales bacterium]